MRRITTAFAVLAIASMPALAGAQARPSVSFVSPRDGASVTGPKVDVKLAFQNFKTVDAGTAVKAGEGHAHVYVDRDALKSGDVIPADQANIVHFGKAPYDLRTVELAPGTHTLVAQLGDSTHKALDVPTAKVSFTVAPARAADTGDGSLAGGSRAGLAIGFGLLTAIAVAVLRRIR